MIDIVKQTNAAQVYVPEYFRLLDMFEGNTYEYIAQSLGEELSADSFRVAKTRIPPINILRRIIKKLSKVYTAVPRRTTMDARDQELVNEYEVSLDLQQVMSDAEDILNLQKCCALEPYLDNGNIKLRVLNPNQFVVFSDDEKNPNKVTTFVKYMGEYRKYREDEQSYTLNIYWIYTDEIFAIMDSEGNYLQPPIPNPYGKIPFVYINSSSYNLMPKPDNDTFQMSILIPKLLSDLNYAVQFQSHSILYSIDAEIQGKASGAPDAMWNLVSKDGENKTPSVGVLSPTTDVDKVLSLITYTLTQWLESRGIMVQSNGSVDANNAASGISKIIDEANTEQVVQENRLILIAAEKRLWDLIATMHNTLLGTEEFNALYGFSELFQVSISFPLQRPIVDPADKRADIKFKLDNGLTTHMRALKEAHPDLTDEELVKLKEEIDAERAIEDAKQKELMAQQNTSNLGN